MKKLLLFLLLLTGVGYSQISPLARKVNTDSLHARIDSLIALGIYDSSQVADTFSVHNNYMHANRDSILAHRTFINANRDSITSHNTRLNAHTDSLNNIYTESQVRDVVDDSLDGYTKIYFTEGTTQNGIAIFYTASGQYITSVPITIDPVIYETNFNNYNVIGIADLTANGITTLDSVYITLLLQNLNANGKDIHNIDSLEWTGTANGDSLYIASRAGIGISTPSRALQVIGGADLDTIRYGSAVAQVIALDGGTVIDWATAYTVFTDTLNANRSINFSNVLVGKSITVYIAASGAFNITWTEGDIDWVGDVAPTQTSSGQDVYEFFCPVEGKIIGSHIPD